MIDPFEHSPWDFWSRADARAQDAQRQVQRDLLLGHPSYRLGVDCFVSTLASVDNEELEFGDGSYIAAGAYLTGSLRAGADCSINPYAVVRGTVTLGDGVRIGAHTSILGFNHTMSDPETPVFQQPLTSRGIRVGNDVWIGSHVVILDGVTVGDHSVLAAGAIVTKDVAAGAIVGGNPARFIRWRVSPAEKPAGGAELDLAERVTRFGEQAHTDAEALLARCWDAERKLFVDRPGSAPTVRAQCDAIEVADLLLRAAPEQLPAEAQVRRLRGWQDAGTGLVPPLAPRDGGADHPGAGDQSNNTAGDPSGGAAGDRGTGSQTLDPGHPDAAYHVLAVGYALDLMGSSFAHPLTFLTEATASGLASTLEALPWRTEAWSAGHRVDALGTALLFSLRRGDDVPAGVPEALFGWLITHADPVTGLWGEPTAAEGLLQPVNGLYRASRGTFAQFGIGLPHPERTIDSVLSHARDETYFARGRRDACNVLDVVHPLWLTRESGYRRAEVTELARNLLTDALSRWMPGRGFAFSEAGDSGAGTAADGPGLQGTEMWLAIIWYLSDLCAVADRLGYRPRGVHRPAAAHALLTR